MKFLFVVFTAVTAVSLIQVDKSIDHSSVNRVAHYSSKLMYSKPLTEEQANQLKDQINNDSKMNSKDKKGMLEIVDSHMQIQNKYFVKQ